MPKGSGFGVRGSVNQRAMCQLLCGLAARPSARQSNLLLFRNHDLRRPHDTVVQLEAALDDVGYRVFWLIWASLLHDCFMARRIELLSDRFDWLTLMALQQCFQLLTHHAKTFEQQIWIRV